MAVLLQQTMPEGIDVSVLDEVSQEMGVEKDPPAGMVVHVHWMQDGRARIVDVWESSEAFEEFQQSRLMPAIAKVTSRRGLSMDSPPESSLTEVDAIIRG